MHSHGLVNSSFDDNLWGALPFDPSPTYGTFLAATTRDLWLWTPDGVWRDPLANIDIDVTEGVLELALREDSLGGSVTVVLRNYDGRYNNMGSGALA